MAFKRNKPSSPLGGHLSSRFAGTKKPIRKRAIFGAIMILVVPYLGSTLAASVTITGRSGGGSIEFAQGSQTTITCDSTIITTLDSSYYSTGDYFKVDTITLSDVNVTAALSATSSDAGCGNKNLTITVYTSSGLATIGNNSATEVKFTVPTSGTTLTPATSPINSGITGSIAITSSTGVITLTLPTGIYVNASNVSRVGIETS